MQTMFACVRECACVHVNEGIRYNNSKQENVEAFNSILCILRVYKTYQQKQQKVGSIVGGLNVEESHWVLVLVCVCWVQRLLSGHLPANPNQQELMAIYQVKATISFIGCWLWSGKRKASGRVRSIPLLLPSLLTPPLPPHITTTTKY